MQQALAAERTGGAGWPVPFVTALLVVALAAGSAAAQTARVSGTVRDEGGRPLRGVTIVAEATDPAPMTASAVSDNRGRFAFSNLLPTLWSVRAMAAGYQTVEQPAELKSGRGNRAIDFVLARRAAKAAAGGRAINIREFQGELDAAAALLDAGQVDLAIQAYRAILERVPAMTQVNLQLGNAYRAKGEYELARASYEAALAADPLSERARIGLGMTHLRSGDLARAEAALTPAATGDVPSPGVSYALGEVTRAQKRPDLASTWYRKAADADPTWPTPLIRLGELAAERGDRDAAILWLEKAIAMAPEAPTATEAKLVLDAVRKRDRTGAAGAGPQTPPCIAHHDDRSGPAEAAGLPPTGP